MVSEYKSEIAPIANRVVGQAATTISKTNNAAGESALGDLIADAQRDFASDESGEPVAFAFTSPGGIRTDIAAGEVIYSKLFTVQPFDDQVVRMNLTGEQIYRLLEQQFAVNRILQISGFEFSYNLTEKRITSVTLPDGSTLPRDDTVYSLAANSFIATGGDGFTIFKEGQNVTTLGSDLDALETYVGDME